MYAALTNYPCDARNPCEEYLSPRKLVIRVLFVSNHVVELMYGTELVVSQPGAAQEGGLTSRAHHVEVKAYGAITMRNREGACFSTAADFGVVPHGCN